MYTSWYEVIDHGGAMVDLDASSVGASSHAVMDHGDAMVDLDAASSLGASSVGGGAMVSFPEQDPAPPSLSLHLRGLKFMILGHPKAPA